MGISVKYFLENWKTIDSDRVNFIYETWCKISCGHILSEDFIREFQDKIDWHCISIYQKLSEEFIREFQDKVNWYEISSSQILSEEFIKEFADKVYWSRISSFQKLSGEFIKEFQDKVYWYEISSSQILSEAFIEEFQDKVNWLYISKYQKLSKKVIREFKNKVNWLYISYYQKLSEGFIREFSDKVNWDYISYSQKLSEKFIKEFNLDISESNWLYITDEEKMKTVVNCGLYEIEGNYIIAYKSTRRNGISVYNSQYRYKAGDIYKSNCNCNIDNDNSFGLSVWTKVGALKYYSNGELYKVRIHISKVGALVQDSNKLRCFELEVLEEIPKSEW